MLYHKNKKPALSPYWQAVAARAESFLEAEIEQYDRRLASRRGANDRLDMFNQISREAAHSVLERVRDGSRLWALDTVLRHDPGFLWRRHR
ncbi:MAG: hypothetical protein H6867_11315 [Rhodospirillales bacterium]|nr:hypothetical protein [Rhodospirillales bacterium]MCB9996718.1 hypothetical protein [Rhodospirillales bacterium]